jgi:hypothetical protein
VTNAEWWRHVGKTPEGSVPVRFQNGTLAWQIACGPAERIVEEFRSAAPPEHWPAWVLEFKAATRERRAVAAKRAAAKNYPPPNARRPGGWQP